MENSSMYRVITKEDPLSLRELPETGRVIARMPAGMVIEASGDGEWLLVDYGGIRGYAAARYLQRLEQAQEDTKENAPQEIEEGQGRMVLTDEAGNTWIPEGAFMVEIRKLED